MRTTCLVLFLCSTLPSALAAQPPAGPYGPLRLSYTVPKDAPHVYYVAPDASPDSPGTTLAQPTTLESAIARVVTGDAVILRGGTYRTGNLVFNQGITIQPYADERPVLKGTRVATAWEPLRNHVWRTPWKTLFPATPADWWQRAREGMRTPLHRFNNDMVFVDGEPLQSAGSEFNLDERSFAIDYEGGYVYIGTDPARRTVEITAFDSAMVRTTARAHDKAPDTRGPVIRGLTLTQYAYRAIEIEGREPDKKSDPATFGKEVVGTTLEHVTITHCSRVAGYFRGDRLTIRHCLISDTSTEGLYIIASADSLLERNIIRRNNTERITGYYPAAVKIFNQSYRVTCRENLVIDQANSNGIWYDVGNVDGVFVNNYVEGAIDGFFFEISKGAICAGNVFVRCENGVRALNSSNVQVYHNTFVDAPATFERSERSAANDHFGWHPSAGPDVDAREGHVFAGNLVVETEAGKRAPLQAVQSAPLCGKLTRSQLSRLDANVYLRLGTHADPLATWSPSAEATCKSEFAGLEPLRALSPDFEKHGRLVDQAFGAVFASPDLSNYTPVGDAAAPLSVDVLPPAVRTLLGWPESASRTPGAYQVRPSAPEAAGRKK